MSDFDLSSFLADQASQGESQGSGGFTISHEKAAKKMAEYSLPRDHAWVLKLIQAGVGWGCEEIKITQTRLDSTFHFRYTSFKALPTNKELVTAILKADLESSKPLDAFAMGLRLLVEKSHLSFHLLIDTGDVEPQAIYAGVYFGELDEKQRAAKREDWGLGITLTIHHIAHTDQNRLLLNYIPIRHHGLPMIEELEYYAFTCPVPLTVDGRRLDGIFRSSRFPWSGYFKPVRTAGIEIPGDEDPAFPMSPGFNNQVLSVFSPQHSLTKIDEGTTAEAFFLLAAKSEKMEYFTTHRPIESSTLFWVRNGVIVDQEPLVPTAQLVRLYLFACADDLRSDLTGFQLLRDQKRMLRSSRLVLRMCQVLRLEKDAGRDLLARPPSVEELDEEQLQNLPGHTQAIARGLRKARQNLEKSAPKSIHYFAKTLIKGAYSALQMKVEEPDNWSGFQFLSRYQSGLTLLGGSLDVEDSERSKAEQKKPSDSTKRNGKSSEK